MSPALAGGHFSTEPPGKPQTFFILIIYFCDHLGFLGGSDGQESACSSGDPSSIPGLGRSPGEGNGYPLQYFCLENSMDGGAWWATVHGVVNSQTWLSDGTETTYTLCVCVRMCMGTYEHECVQACGVPSPPGNAFSLRYCCLVSCRALSLVWLGKLPFFLFAWLYFSPYGKFP